MAAPRTYDLFLTHAWRYHEDWVRLAEMFDRAPGVAWRNFSLPWHDPAMDPNSTVGGRFIRDFLETQIIPVHGVLFLSGVYAIRSARHWLDFELELARRHGKPVIAVPAAGMTAVPGEVAALCDATAEWNADDILAALNTLAAQPKK